MSSESRSKLCASSARSCLVPLACSSGCRSSTTPLHSLESGFASGLGAGGHEVGVVLGGHGSKTSSRRGRGDRETLHRTRHL